MKNRHVTKKPVWRKCCPACGRWVSDPANYVYSFRFEPSGKIRLVELCRWCRDAELRSEGKAVPPVTQEVTVWIEEATAWIGRGQPWKH